MKRPPVIGLSGVAGAGKDTVFDRLEALCFSVQRRSVADPLKESISALWGVSLERLEELKRDENSFVTIGGTGEPSLQTDGAFMRRTDAKMSVREFMQKYGTEAHRDQFGEDFWLNIWSQEIETRKLRDGVLRVGPYTYVNTSVRFANEAERVLRMGGEVWHIDGPQDPGAGGHESEQRLPDELITRTIDNTVRAYHQLIDAEGNESTAPNYEPLDDQIALILDEWKQA